MKSVPRPRRGLPGLLTFAAVALLAGAASAPVPAGLAAPGADAASSVTVWDAWSGGPGARRPLLYPIAAVPAPAPRAVGDERPVGPGPAPREAAGPLALPGARPFAVVPARRPPHVFGAAGAERCRLVCVYRL